MTGRFALASLADLLDQDGNRSALAHAFDVVDVAQVLAVDVERERLVADDLDAVEVVTVEDVDRALVAAAFHQVGEDPGDGERAQADRRDDVEPVLEPG